MTSRDRYVFDTNVVVSALLFTDSTPGRALISALRDGEILLSVPVLEELNEVLSRKKFDPYLLRGERERFLAALVRQATLVEIAETIQFCRDPKDDKFLELAVSGGAKYIVTGDEDLLELGSFRGVSILTAERFLTLLAESDAS